MKVPKKMRPRAGVLSVAHVVQGGNRNVMVSCGESMFDLENCDLVIFKKADSAKIKIENRARIGDSQSFGSLMGVFDLYRLIMELPVDRLMQYRLPRRTVSALNEGER